MEKQTTPITNEIPESNCRKVCKPPIDEKLIDDLKKINNLLIHTDQKHNLFDV